ncbi:hypothetical protein GE061_011528 [Apolygus lucorum]|uniref:WASH complex subunit strumpellin n=1 Tax=Apolygus lucorum TaxID=248454 RepID=A0A8S9Y0E4_APOLU|nr:hypothetical protein GE061_011528 [Apolygus lucorum]
MEAKSMDSPIDSVISQKLKPECKLRNVRIARLYCCLRGIDVKKCAIVNLTTLQQDVNNSMEEDFLAPNNPCGQALLQLVSRGNAIIAELLRLKDHIPSIFRLENKQDIVKYGEIIQDFNYFHSPDVVEKKIDSAENLREISEEIRDYYGDVLHRFYVAYDSIYKYISDLNTFIEELVDGTYIQQNMDTVFLSEDGVQLMCESAYLYGVMLLVLELYHPGTLRERLIVAYSRYNITVGTLDHVCQLVRSTGFMNTANAKRPPNYPTEYFK